MSASLDDIHGYIRDEIEESLTLEYKAAAALGRSPSKKKEITKDVSSMANSAGGRIVYGVAEFQSEEKSHLPERIDTVNRREFSKEWLEQIIGQIRPRITGLLITPVVVDSDEEVLYVVDVPQSDTAHQASDYRYYRRYNFQSVPMEDHEVRDVMGRGAHPQLEVRAYITLQEWTQQGLLGRGDTARRRVELHLVVENVGSQLARYVNGFVRLPARIDPDWTPDFDALDLGGSRDFIVSFENTKRDIVDVEPGTPGISGPRRKYGPSWYAPVLPGRSRRVETTLLVKTLQPDHIDDEDELYWKVYADNAPPREGRIPLSDLEWIER